MTNTPTPAPAPAVRRPAATLAVEVRNAVKVYGEGPAQVVALNNVTVGFPTGQFTAIMGPSGSGKSTLLHCMAALDRLTDGTVLLDGIDLASLSERKLTLLRRAKIGFVFQSYNLVPTLTAYENITLPIDLAGDRVNERWLGRVVDAFGLRSRLSHHPSELSGGQQQRTAVARALASRPAVVFADEPTGNLDTRSSTELLNVLRAAVDHFAQTVIMVTHDAAAAARADRVLFLVDGRIVRELLNPNVEAVLDCMKSLGE